MLCDSNILIYGAEPDETRLDPFLHNPNACIASITRIEVLGFTGFEKLDAARKKRLSNLVASLVELPLNETIIQEAITLRRQRKMSLGDAIIGATALIYGLALVTRNTDDFKHLAGLQLINPYHQLA